MSGRLAVAFPWLFLLAAFGIVAWDHAAPRTTLVAAGETRAALDGGAPATARDPVCGMTVRTSTAHGLVYGGRLHHFCSTDCRDEAAADPARWLAARAQPADAGHTMRGIPSWMFQLGVGLVLVVSFGLFELAERLRGARSDAALANRLDLAPAGSLPLRLYRSRGFRLALQIAMTAVLALIVAAGLFGSQNPAFNIAPILTWTLWWAGLVFFVLYAGKLWCWVCPWDAAATWLERLPLGPRGARLGLRLPWPRRLRNIWLAVGFFVALTWIELGQGITSIPRMTAVLALAMLALTIAGSLVFDRKSFCRYGCLVGRVSGLYALFSSLELRARTPAACAGCLTRDCYRGSARGEGCPTFQYPATMSRSTYCTLCAECVRTCPKDNVTLRLRPWGADLAGRGRARADEAVLALILLSMTGLHGLTMIPSWPRRLEAFGAALHLPPTAAFSAFAALTIVVPIALFWLLASTSAAAARTLSTRAVFLHYAYALLPIALFYHLAHTAQHFLMEGPKVLAIASDPFGAGYDLFGTARITFAPAVSLEGLWALQVLFVVVGHLYGLWISARTTRRLVPDAGRGFAVQLPMLAAMILSSWASLWLLSQPMEMRVAAL